MGLQAFFADRKKIGLLLLFFVLVFFALAVKFEFPLQKPVIPKQAIKPTPRVVSTPSPSATVSTATSSPFTSSASPMLSTHPTLSATPAPSFTPSVSPVSPTLFTTPIVSPSFSPTASPSAPPTPFPSSTPSPSPAATPTPTVNYYCDVTVYGASPGGVAAAIQSARLGVNTCLVEESPLLGDLFLASPAFEPSFEKKGFASARSGLLKEFYDKVKARYPGINLSSCYWGLECFEPSVAESVFEEMVAAEPKLSLFKQHSLYYIEKSGGRVSSIIVKSSSGELKRLVLKVLVGADAFGDALKASGALYRLGREAKSETGEEDAPVVADDVIQPFASIMIWRDYGVNSMIPQPQNYLEDNYVCLIQNDLCPNAMTWNSFSSYTKLPVNQKYYVNYGVDYCAPSNELIEGSTAQRGYWIEKGKQNSLGFLYFVQTVLGKNTLGLFNEYSSLDSFSFVPYVRESRRLVGLKTIKENDVLTSKKDVNALALVFYVGIDVHPCNGVGGLARWTDFWLHLPLEVFVSVNVDNLVAGSVRGLSVTHIANGGLRINSIDLIAGQAAGALAATAVLQGVSPKNVDAREVQKKLLDNGLMLYYFADVPKTHWAWKQIQFLATRGIMGGTSSDSFSPNASLQRSSAAVVIVNALGLQLNTSGGPHFIDVPSTHWAYAQIETVYNNGFSGGCAPNQYCPENAATRAQFVAMLVRGLGLPLVNPDAPTFVDVPKTHWAYRYVETAVAHGIASGYNATHFGPEDAVKRDQAAVMVYNALES